MIDFILGLILAGFALKGLLTGLVRTVVTIAAVAAAWLVSSMEPMLAAPLVALFAEPEAPFFPLVVRLTTWVGAFAAVQIAGHFIAGFFEKAGLGGADRLGGLLLGAATGVAVGCLPLFVIYAIPPLYHWEKTQEAIAQSTLLTAYTPIVRMVVQPPPKPQPAARR